jgi:hypothetical protein
LLLTFGAALVVGAVAQTTIGNGGATSSGKKFVFSEEAVRLET